MVMQSENINITHYFIIVVDVTYCLDKVLAYQRFICRWAFLSDVPVKQRTLLHRWDKSQYLQCVIPRDGDKVEPHTP
jgi:hypothetical protein